MRRTLPVAFFSALLATLPSVLAQHTGAHPGGFSGSHGSASAGHSFSGGFSPGSYGRSSGFAPRTFTSAPRMTSTAPGRAFVPGYQLPGSGTPARSRAGRDGYRYRSPYRGYAYAGYPAYANSWQLLPWDLGYPGLGWDNNSYDSNSNAAQQPAESIDPPGSGNRSDYQESPYPVAADPLPADSPLAPEPQLTLIFKDGHQEPIRNYVLTSDTVIVLDQAAAGRQQRVPLAELNLSATEEAAQRAGLEFSPPA